MNSDIRVEHRQAAGDVPRTLVLLLAVGAGLAVASLYYCQPMLGALRVALGTREEAMGGVPTFLQLGYALGILLLSPLGDRHDRRRLILVKAVVLAAALAASGMAESLGQLLAASAAVAATMAQDLVPAAAILAPAGRRGKVIGTVMSGLLLGILLSRVVSGVVAERWGWRVVYFGAAAAVLGLVPALYRYLPRFPAETGLGYGALLGSMAALWRRHEAVRRAVATQALLAVGFSAFWCALAVLLEQQFHLGSAVAGTFGLAGAAGSAAAPLAGRLADRRGPEFAARLGAVAALVSFAALGAGPLLAGGWRLALLALSAVGFDFGVQAALVAHQTTVYGADPAARSRLNAILFTGMFAGMAAGSALGGVAVARWGWMGVAGLCTGASLCALAVRVAPRGGAAAGLCGQEC